jgi:hypothetical protein
MKTNTITWKRFLFASILSWALISVSAHATTITFFLDEKGVVSTNLNKIKNLDPSTYAVVELGNKADSGFGKYKLIGKKMKAKGNSSWTHMSTAYDWTGSLEYFLEEHFHVDDISLKKAEFVSSKPIPNPIHSTIWIFGAGLIGLIGIRRKLLSYIS